ncbi:MAG: 50S ribosomal protein L11 methyltransferase [Tannerella sp.]|jgi:ribosomal protein L11 methyltransferase|nr:50S ribosomal protein L11 methyltransferase [Tannerella sp.]
MNYYELTFTYDSPAPDEIVGDLLAAALGDIGFESFVMSEAGMQAFVPEKTYNEDVLLACLDDFPIEKTIFRYDAKLIEQRNWNEEWEKNYFKPIRIGKECFIRASFHPDEHGFKFKIIIDPKMAFGTGNHATTSLMLEEILRHDLTGADVLDMGCGTAVLAILCRMKGARRVVAVDIDEWAYANALENCLLNDTADIRVEQGGAEIIPALGQFDYIFANINRNILLADIRHYVQALKPCGKLFTSGFYDTDLPVITAECDNNDLRFISSSIRDKWVAAGFENS